MKHSVVVLLTVMALTACASDPDGTATSLPAETAPVARDAVPASEAGTARLLFAGDVMLGRRVGPVAAAEGPEFMEAVRYVVSSADVAAANLESPLTDRPHLSDNPNALEATPEVAGLVAGAGFDLMSVANNHATDAGAAGLLDTIEALEARGVVALGGGRSVADAMAPHVAEHNGVTVAFLAFDATRLATSATADSVGVATYERDSARAAVQAAAADSDVLAVSLHGGVEYLLDNDPVLGDIADDLVAWGADIVWGHGAHVAQPVTVVDAPGGRSAVVATSLGNFVFDQQRPATQTGLLLEVLVSDGGVVAYRVGRASHPEMRPTFDMWDLPVGPAAVSLGGEWWSLVVPPEVRAAAPVQIPGFTQGDVTTAAFGDATGDGRAEYAGPTVIRSARIQSIVCIRIGIGRMPRDEAPISACSTRTPSRRYGRPGRCCGPLPGSPCATAAWRWRSTRSTRPRSSQRVHGAGGTSDLSCPLNCPAAVGRRAPTSTVTAARTR